MLQVQRPTFCEGAPSLRSGPGSTFWLSVHAGPSLRSGPGSTFWPPVHALSPGTIFCECPVRARTLTSFGFALTLRPDVKRWTLTSFRSGLNILAVGSCFQSGHDFFVSAQFSVRCFVRTPFVSAHPHFVRVRAYTLDRCSTLDPHFVRIRANTSN